MSFRIRLLAILVWTLSATQFSLSSATASSLSYNAIFAKWAIEGEQKESLGFLSFFEVSTDAPGADGQLFRNAGFFTSVSDVDVRVRNLTREAYDFDVVFRPVSSGNKVNGRLLISLMGLNPSRLKGSIEIDGQFRLITLVKQQQSAPNTFNNPDELEGNDLPGFGITGPAYRLRNVPRGNNLVVRSRPERSASIVARMDASTAEILVMNCSPAIDSVQFDSATRDGKRELLSGTWCRIQTPSPNRRQGYILGRYLDPILGR